MAFIRNIIIITLLSLAGFFVYGQEEQVQPEEKLGQQEPIYDSVIDRVLLRREYSGGLILHSRGWGFHFRKGKNINYFRSILWEVDAVSLKSPKQIT